MLPQNEGRELIDKSELLRVAAKKEKLLQALKEILAIQPQSEGNGVYNYQRAYDDMTDIALKALKGE